MTCRGSLRAHWLAVLLFCGQGGINAQLRTQPATTETVQPHAVWDDSLTGLTWTVRDNGKDVSWKGALKYCRTLKLGGFADWRLANMFELQGVYDAKLAAPGRAGDTKGGVPRAFSWHVRGDLYLTGDEWGGASDSQEKSGGYKPYFDFNEGKSNDQPVGWLYPYNGMRALCVRGSGDPLGAQRKVAQTSAK